MENEPNAFDYSLSQVENDYYLLNTDKFDYDIQKQGEFTAEWYYENFKGFPDYYYKILAESSGVPCDRKELRKIIKKEKKRMKKWRNRMNKLNRLKIEDVQTKEIV